MLSVETRKDGIAVQVVYRTSRKVTSLRAGEFAILRGVHPAAFELAGLAFETKFDCKQLIDLSWSQRYFKVPPNPHHGQTPKLGTLHPCMYHAAKTAFKAVAKR